MSNVRCETCTFCSPTERRPKPLHAVAPMKIYMHSFSARAELHGTNLNVTMSLLKRTFLNFQPQRRQGHNFVKASSKRIPLNLKSAGPGLRQGRGGVELVLVMWAEPQLPSLGSDEGLSSVSQRRKGVQGCRLPGLKTRKPLPAALTSSSGRGILFLLAFKAAVFQASKSSNRPLQLSRAIRAMAVSLFTGVQGCRLPGLKPANLPLNFQDPLKPWHSLFTGVQGCCLPSFKTRKPSLAALTSHSARGILFLLAFKAGVCQASKPRHPPPQLARATGAMAFSFTGVQDYGLPGFIQTHKPAAAAPASH